MLEKLKKEVLDANLLLPKFGLVDLTWGNVSGLDESGKYIVIKPSGVAYEKMTASNMVVVDFDGKVVDGKLNPSSDLLTHIELYKNFKGIKGVVHTHSKFATAFAQAKRPITAFGTTHADYFYGDIPVTRLLTKEEVESAYELNTGKVIVERFENLDYNAIPAVVVASHGLFTWGGSPKKAVENALVTERSAEMAYMTLMLGNEDRIEQYVMDKHYYRKHGENAYYGQKK